MASSCKIRSHALRLPSRGWNHPHGGGPRYRFVDGIRAGPICHFAAVRRKPWSKSPARYQPALTAKYRNLVDAAAITIRAKNYLAAVWRKIRPGVPRAVESQTNRLAASNLLDIKVHSAVPAGIGRVSQ